MTQEIPFTPEEEMDALAAEYVLGVLDLPDLRAAEERLRRDSAFAARVAVWEGHLSPLNAEFEPVPAPDMLAKIEARLFPVPAPAPRRGWSGLFGGALGTLAVLGVVGFFFVVPPTPDLVATMSTADAAVTYRAEFDNGKMNVIRVAGQAADAAHVHELWIIAPGAAPASLGLLQEAVLTVDYPVPPKGWVLAITLEPAGGAPGGIPSGPILMSTEIGA